MKLQVLKTPRFSSANFSVTGVYWVYHFCQLSSLTSINLGTEEPEVHFCGQTLSVRAHHKTPWSFWLLTRECSHHVTVRPRLRGTPGRTSITLQVLKVSISILKKLPEEDPCSQNYNYRCDKYWAVCADVHLCKVEPSLLSEKCIISASLLASFNTLLALWHRVSAFASSANCWDCCTKQREKLQEGTMKYQEFWGKLQFLWSNSSSFQMFLSHKKICDSKKRVFDYWSYSHMYCLYGRARCSFQCVCSQVVEDCCL